MNLSELTTMLPAADMEFQIWEHHPDKDSRCLCRRRGGQIKSVFHDLAVGEDRPIGDYTYIVRSR